MIHLPHAMYTAADLIELATDELMQRKPAAPMTYTFDDGTAVTLPSDQWRRPEAEQRAQAKMIHLVDAKELTPRDSYGIKCDGDQDAYLVLKTRSFDRADAERFLLECEISVGEELALEEAVTTKPLGVTKSAIIGAFPPPDRRTPEQWEKALGDAGRTVWLKPARVGSGGRGTSALWNPARLAACLCDQYRATPQQRRDYGRIITKHFPDWLPEWQKYADSFE